jgi:shikimate dehydrogenase
MQTAAVIGHPIGHSLSPAIHGYWLEALKMPGEYRRHDVAPEDLKSAIQRFRREGYVGLNVTLPHKESVLPLCHELSEAARAVGAVNTMVFANDKIYGDNTDAEGFSENLLAHQPDEDLPHAIILGAGGAARAAVYALKLLGTEKFQIHNRDLGRAEKLLDELQVAGEAVTMGASIMPDAAILVNCTSLGMKGQPPLAVDIRGLAPRAIVADVVYQPLQTALLQQAEKRGHRTVDGLGMLIHQAASAFEQFYGVEAGEKIKLRKILEGKLI